MQHNIPQDFVCFFNYNNTKNHYIFLFLSHINLCNRSRKYEMRMKK